MKKHALAAMVAACTAAPVAAQVIVTTDYRPPETAQRVVIPVNPRKSASRRAASSFP
jgi:hypothetical protein